MTSRPTHLLIAAGLLSLAACSSAERSAPSFGQTFAGVWTVTHAWPAGAVVASPAPQGQSVAITAASAADPLGHACPEPTYVMTPGRVAVALGIEAPAADEGMVLDVACDGRPFTRYVAHNGRLLATAEGWLFELRPAATVAAERRPVVATAASTAAAPGRPVKPVKPVNQVKPVKPAAPAKPVQAAAKPAPTGNGTVYLASYRSPESAKAGWAVLQRQAAGLKALQPVFKEVDLGAKGRFVRLYASGASAQTQGEICAALKKTSPDCGAKY